jgi:acetyl-CoA synthetase
MAVGSVRAHGIGPIASPDIIYWTERLPKTRSGKIMRRVLRKIAAAELEELGDTSTLAAPAVTEELVTQRRAIPPRPIPKGRRR